MAANHCERCGRNPAKYMTFKAHQGFVVFRREYEIAGMWCRDCAMAAYATARGVTLKGMWFSPSSLMLGTLRSVWDAAKLLDLPNPVKDEPWVPLKVACPTCNQEHFALAGPTDCTRCGYGFVVGSCHRCGAIGSAVPNGKPDSVRFFCPQCSIVTDAPLYVRNWPFLIISRAVAEVCATIAHADGFVDEKERAYFRNRVAGLASFEKSTLDWLDSYFNQCISGNSSGVLAICARNCDLQFIRLVLAIAVGMVEADGEVDQKELGALRNLAASLDLNPDDIFGEYERQHGDSVPWWDVLSVRQDATLEQVTFAYQRLAKQFHPDLWHSASEVERKRAEARMKEVNAAYERAASSIRQNAESKRETTRRDDRKRERKQQDAARAETNQAAPRKAERQPDDDHDRREKPQANTQLQLTRRDVTQGADVRRRTAEGVHGSRKKPKQRSSDHKSEEVKHSASSRPARAGATEYSPTVPRAVHIGKAVLLLSIIVIGFFVVSTWARSNRRLVDGSTTVQAVPPVVILPPFTPPPITPPPVTPPTVDDPLTVVEATQEVRIIRSGAQTPPSKDAALQLNEGLSRHKSGDPYAAIVIYTKLIKDHPRYAKAWSNRGYAWLHLGQYWAAIEDCTNAISLDSTLDVAYSNLGRAHLGLKQYEQAIVNCRKAVGINPKNTSAFETLSLAYELMSQPDRAEKRPQQEHVIDR